MGRNRIDRKVCFIPGNQEFCAKGSQQQPKIFLSLEEYETIRLIDYIGLTQEECANHMKVARTTVQKIYNDARHKLSIFLVEGQDLFITGGNYEICPNQQCHTCEKREIYRQFRERGRQR